MVKKKTEFNMLTILNIKLMPGIGDPFEFKILNSLDII